MIYKSVRYVCILLAVFLFAAAVQTNVFAVSTLMTEYEECPAAVMGIAHRGDTENFPENSVEGIEECIEYGLDGVSADVRKTSDGRLILMADETVLRMCGKNLKVSDTDYETLSQLNLLSGSGGDTAQETEYKIPLLSRALETAGGKILLILDCREEELDDVYNEVVTYTAAEDVIIRCREMKNSDLINWAQSKKKSIKVMAYHKSNVIFRAVNQFRKAEKADLGCVQFATSNRYGVIFSHIFTGRFGETRGYFSFADIGRCGDRPDTIIGWENIINSGYSIIESNNARELSEYIKTLESSRYELVKQYEKAKTIDTDEYTSATAKKLNDAYKDADEALNGEYPSSNSKLSEINSSLKSAVNNLVKSDSNDYGEGEFKITLPRAMWALLIVVLFAASQIYIKKKTMK